MTFYCRWLFGIRQHLCQQHKLQKCDVDAQVITDVIAETLPVNSPPKKVSSVFKTPNEQSLKVTGRQSQDLGTFSIEAKGDNSSISNISVTNSCSSSNANISIEGSSTSALQTNNIVSVATSVQSFHYERSEPNVCTNLTDWKKLL